jgi:hypothetical protein
MIVRVGCRVRRVILTAARRCLLVAVLTRPQTCFLTLRLDQDLRSVARKRVSHGLFPLFGRVVDLLFTIGCLGCDRSRALI